MPYLAGWRQPCPSSFPRIAFANEHAAKSRDTFNTLLFSFLPSALRYANARASCSYVGVVARLALGVDWRGLEGAQLVRFGRHLGTVAGCTSNQRLANVGMARKGQVMREGGKRTTGNDDSAINIRLKNSEKQ
jgi:hypothetical protein